MNARPSELLYPREPACAVAQDVLQRRLDGEFVDVPSAVAAHVASCEDCRGRFAAAGPLLTALTGTELPVSPLLTERIVAAAIADLRRRRQVRRWSLAAAGLAAGVMAALWLIRPPAPMTPVPEIVERAAPLDLQQDFTEAGEAVVALTRRAAVDAVDAGRQLVPTVPPPSWPLGLDAGRSFDEAGAGLADGFEPVATSARRAARLFWRELPMSESKVD